MTQIFTVLTQEFVVTVADRRITHLRGQQILEDDECKMVSIGGGSTVSYTGLARVGRTPTHEWIATRLAQHGCTSGAQAVDILEREATEQWRVLHRLPHFFVVSGWEEVSRGASQSRVLPTVCIVSNVAPDGSLLPQFSRQLLAVEPGEASIFDCRGVSLSRQRTAHILRVLSSILRRRIEPMATARFLASEIAQTESLSKMVSRRVLGVVIRKEAGARALLGRGGLQEFGAPGQALSEFVYVDPDDNSVRRCGPTTVWKHWAFTDLTVKGLGAGEDGECVIRLLRVPTEAERLRDPDNEIPVFGLVGGP